MKRVLLIAVVLLFVSGIVFAQGDTHSRYIYEYRVKNATGAAKTTIIPITSIRPGVDKLVGYRVLPAGPGSTESYCGLYDGTDYFLSGESFGESEAPNGASDGELWLIPKQILLGVVVQQGANSIAIVYFVRE